MSIFFSLKSKYFLLWNNFKHSRVFCNFASLSLLPQSCMFSHSTYIFLCCRVQLPTIPQAVLDIHLWLLAIIDSNQCPWQVLLLSVYWKHAIKLLSRRAASDSPSCFMLWSSYLAVRGFWFHLTGVIVLPPIFSFSVSFQFHCLAKF